MDRPSNDITLNSAPRPLSDDERQFLRDWTAVTRRFFAFVSERHSDDPAIYRRVVVAHRATKQHLYLLHAAKGGTYWTMLSAVEGNYIGRFPTLRAALNYIESVTQAAPVAGLPTIDKPPPRRARLSTGQAIICWLCAIAIVLLIARWFSWGSGVEDANDHAQAIAESALRASLGDPASTLFRNVMAYKVGPNNERWVCGWFYTKNPAGEVLGPNRFVVHVILRDGDSATPDANVGSHLVMSETEVPGMSYAWSNYCH